LAAAGAGATEVSFPEFEFVLVVVEELFSFFLEASSVLSSPLSISWSTF
jgi:hypothetical protein